MSSPAAKLKVAYLLKTFPRLSETFILNEILGLEKLGIQLEIFSLRRPTAEPSHPAVSEMKSSVTYIPSLSWSLWPVALAQLIWSHLVVLLTGRRRYFTTAGFYFRVKGASRFEDFLQAPHLARGLRRKQITHLHAHFANVPTTVAELAHHLIGIPFSFTAHAKDIYLTTPSELERKIRSATAVLTCTAHNQQYLAQLAEPGRSIHLAYHGVDFERFGAALCPRSTGTRQLPLILSVGRFCEKKGFEYLIRACRFLANRGYTFRCQIVGYGGLQDKLERLIIDLGLQQFVSLLGKKKQDQLAALYTQARMFVLPCIVTDQGDRDGIPNVLIEAMACEVPVVSTDISGISELVTHSQTGLLVRQRDPHALADAMELLLLRSDLCRRLAQNGRQCVLDKFTLNASAQHVHDILLSVLTTISQPSASQSQLTVTEF